MGAVSNGGIRRRGGDTDMGWLCYVFLAFLCIFCNLGGSTDSLRRGESITPNRTLLSAGGNFALGFFRPGNSSSSFLGIWYNSINKTVIWVANRESPLPPQDSEAVFTLGYDGNLQILDGGGRNIIWSTNISGGGGGSTAAQLQDTGDLVVKQGESIVWESFDGDSDTLMQGMRLMVNKKTGKRNVIRCWSSSDDPRPGKFSWGVDPKGSPQFFIWKEDKPYFRSTMLQQGFTYSVYFPSGGYAYYSYATQNDEVYYSYGYTNTSIQARFLLTPEGRLQFLLRQNTSDEWPKLWEAPTTECELYAHCGSFGSCERFDSHSVCGCLEGFKPRSQRDWDKGKYDAGCERSIALGCGEADTFMRYALMKWPDHSSSLGIMTFQECEMECSKNCSCTAFGYANITSNSAVDCINWFGDLIDLAHNYSPGGFGQDLYVRVHSSDLSYGSSGNDDSPHRNKRLVAIIVASVSSFFLLTVLVYILTCGRKGWVCKKSRESSDAPLLGKDDIELLQLSFRRIIDATNNFDEANKLGEGGFGPVYKGFLSEFGMVAIKRLSKQSSQGLKEFMNELKLIAKLQHTNLVRLLGCCIEERILLCLLKISEAVFTLVYDGEFAVLGGGEDKYYMAKPISAGGGGSTAAQLQRYGDLGCESGCESICWESFRWGQAIVMQGMRLMETRNRKRNVDLSVGVAVMIPAGNILVGSGSLKDLPSFSFWKKINLILEHHVTQGFIQCPFTFPQVPLGLRRGSHSVLLRQNTSDEMAKTVEHQPWCEFEQLWFIGAVRDSIPLGLRCLEGFFNQDHREIGDKGKYDAELNVEMGVLELLTHRGWENIDCYRTNFDEANKLVGGGFGPVYKGVLSEVGMVAHSRRYPRHHSQGLKELMIELKLIANYSIQNLSGPIGLLHEA
nr:G-type lectin S-receptor-like serine/threonine-protein kinase At4g27290 [Ipomoea batatas]